MSAEREFERCKPWLEAALAEGYATRDISDVERALRHGLMQFWPGAQCAMVTELVDHPRKRVLCIYLAGGNLEELKAMYPSVEAFAREMNADAVVVNGRPGWKKVFAPHGVRAGVVQFVKELKK